MNIFALSTGKGPSGIAILRLSGKDSLQISKLITKKNDIKSKEVNLCKFHDPSNDEIIDEGLLLWFPGPNSYTGEDLAEFHTHGSNAVVSCFLRVLSEQENCRLAEPGEFTKIAFQNNKIDLIEAESIGDLIHAETELQRQQAIKLVQGNASNYYNSLREKLVKSLSYIEAKIDFAEDDLPENVLKKVQNSIKEVHKDIKQILEDEKIGEKIRDGFKISIVGQVNAGKSSLLNLLSKREAAIVSEEEGTTRDVIETYLNIDGYPVILADTAGIRKVKNKVEKEGIQRAIKKAKNADLTLVMIDNSLKQIDKDLKKLINENCILVFNKSDLNKKILKNEFIKNDQVLISAKNNQNIDKLVKTIKDKLSKKFTNANNILVTRERHRAKLNDALKEIEKFLKKDQQKEIETAAEDLRLATRHLASIVGKVDVEEILSSIFQDFCIGK
jgi:tRNA modification GTPase